MEVPQVIVLDGYDGSGKTTLANMLVQELGGRYIKSFKDSLGWLIWSLFADQEFDLADLVSRTACRKEEETNRDASFLIFDRHWMTMFTLLPELYHVNWEPLPKAFLCRADIEIIVKRLHSRGEKLETSIDVHLEQQRRFDNLAEKFRVPIIDTSSRSPVESIDIIYSSL